MRLAELSRRSGVSRSTIKFYLREGLLPAGEPQARNQARYGPEHLERLALVTALREVAGLSIEVIARVTAELDRGWEGADAIGAAFRAIHAPGEPAEAERAERDALAGEVRAFLRELPWTTPDEGYYFADELAEALLLVRRHLYPGYAVADLAPYAAVAWLLSEVEFAVAPGGPRVPLRAQRDDIAEPTRRAIVSALLFERIFAALRRCANSMRSIRLSEGKPLPPDRDGLPGPDGS
jgi:DNA-binding transcriptional MerR regulator